MTSYLRARYKISFDMLTLFLVQVGKPLFAGFVWDLSLNMVNKVAASQPISSICWN